jgi:hypothetical protein
MLVEKIKDFVKNKFGGLTITKPVKNAIIIAISIIVLFIVLYFSCWVYLFVTDDKMRIQLIPELRQFITLLLGGGTLTVFYGFVKMLIDVDGDGIPDELEKSNIEQQISTTIEKTPEMLRK